MTTYFTSDTHFDDARRIKVDHRPFATIEDHDAALIARWNEVVGEDDDVFHLGDFTASKSQERVSALLHALKGRKHLITGNNDPPTTTENKSWLSVAPYQELEIDGRRIILCHYAFRTWRDMGKGAINLHGHSHGRLKEETRQYDVGVDVFDYRPVTLETILASKRGRRSP